MSNLPGTTLNFLTIRLPSGITMVDTPGLLNDGQLTTKLTTEELRQVIPVTPINPVTFRCGEGKTVMIGGLAKVEVLEGLPFFLTFFISNEIKLHPTSADKANDPDWVERHVGSLMAPPSSAERLRRGLAPASFHSRRKSASANNQSGKDLGICLLGGSEADHGLR